MDRGECTCQEHRETGLYSTTRCSALLRVLNAPRYEASAAGPIAEPVRLVQTLMLRSVGARDVLSTICCYAYVPQLSPTCMCGGGGRRRTSRVLRKAGGGQLPSS